MSAGIDTARRVVLRFRVVPVVLISLAAGLGSVIPAQAVAHTSSAGSFFSGRALSKGTAYVVNGGSDTVTPIATATNAAGPPIPVGSDPGAIAITPGHRHSKARLHQRLRYHGGILQGREPEPLTSWLQNTPRLSATIAYLGLEPRRVYQDRPASLLWSGLVVSDDGLASSSRSQLTSAFRLDNAGRCVAA